MKRTLLDMTQSILSSLGSDEVNSISDTTESLQVAEVIKTTYFNIINRINLPNHNQLIQLDPSLDATMPVLMYVPEHIARLDWLKYFNTNVLQGSGNFGYQHDLNVDIQPPWTTTSSTTNTIALGTQIFTVPSGLTITQNNGALCVSGVNTMFGTVVSYVGTVLTLDITSIDGTGTYSSWIISESDGGVAIPGYEYVTILPIQQFIDMVNSFNPADSNVQSFTLNDNSNGFNGAYTFYYKNNKQPQFCTILSNYYVIFDGYDNTQDSTLQASKTMSFGEVIPSFSMTDSFIPNLGDEQFPLLLNEAKSLAFFELKQQPHPKAEQEAKRGWSAVQRDKAVINRPTYFDALPNFGRRGYSGQSFFKRMGWDRSSG